MYYFIAYCRPDYPYLAEKICEVKAVAEKHNGIPVGHQPITGSERLSFLFLFRQKNWADAFYEEAKHFDYVQSCRYGWMSWNLEHKNVKEIYDLETLRKGYSGNDNKLCKSRLESLLSLGKDGILEILEKSKENVKFQQYNDKTILNNGNHRAFAAHLLGIEKIPCYERFLLVPNQDRKLVHISEWEVLPDEDWKKYYLC